MDCCRPARPDTLKRLDASMCGMQTLSVLGPGAAEVVGSLAAVLDGRVATIDRTETNPVEPETADGAYELGPEGSWRGTTAGSGLQSLLDDLAGEFDYALLAGVSRTRMPTVVIGNHELPEGALLLERVADRSALELEAIATTLEETEPYVTLETLIDRVKASPKAERSGAIATFTGRVRAKDAPDDSPTEALTFEKYEGVAETAMARIESELAERDGVLEVQMHHRVGRIEDGEDIVFVVVLAGHRTEAFRAVEDGINRLKDEVPIFKKETTADSEFWVHERSE